MGGNEGSILMLQGWGGKAQAGTHTVSIRLAPQRRAGVDTPAHWVQAAQGIWLTVHGHADRKETHPNQFIHRTTKGIYTGEFTHTHTLSHKSTKRISSFTKQTGSIKMDNPTNSKRQEYGGQRTILQTHTDAHIKPGLNPSITAELKKAFSC